MKPLIALVCAGATLAATPPRVPQPEAAPALLHRAATYLAEYELQFSLLVSEETYTQIEKSPGLTLLDSRTLKSDVMVLDGGAAGWIGFRDVYDVDGHAVRDHQNRLLALVTSPVPDPLSQAKRLADEGSRFNLGPVSRTINIPTLALTFLRETMQARSAWTVGGRKKLDGHETTELRFVEQASPRVIQTADAAAAKGRFWVETDTGRVVRTELLIESAGMSGTITTTFGSAPKFGGWVPVSMDEACQWSAGSIEGHAKYQNFRTFGVDANAMIVKR